ncbi:MAG: sugar-binding protein [Victivallaceae bacterium]
MAFSVNIFAFVAEKKEPPTPNRSADSAKYAVQISAKVQEKPAQIKLNWPEEKTAFAYTLYRRFLGEKQWIPVPIAVLDGKAAGFVDNKVKTGEIYEYRVDRSGSGYIGRGYICSGINIPAVNDRGQLILLVEKSIADPLKAELTLLEQDLAGDGWQVIRHDVARDAKVIEVKKLIESAYRKNPEQLHTVFLFGHVPVPYSGSISPDGHTNHLGAWPADLYYGDMNGKWTDEKKLKYAPLPLQKNEPGDGKFDQSTIPPNSLVLEVGRVDLSDMPQFEQNEVELLRRYLNKDHVFRHGHVQAKPRGLIDDHFGGFAGEAFGSSGWSNFAAFFDADKNVSADWFTTLPSNSYLWAYGCGAGSHDRAGGVGTTADFAKMPVNAVFTMLFGSYFGDWNRQNNFMRAPLANSGDALTCVWNGRPHWYLHHMAIGKNIGYSTLRTQNNNQLQDYIGCNNAKSSVSGKDEDAEWDYNSIHVALMGDPALRMHPVQPPRSCSAISLPGNKLKLQWQPAEEKNIAGYQIFRADKLSGPYTLLNKEPAAGTEYTVSGVKSEDVYMIKSLALQNSGSGTYWNTSQGIFIRPLAAGASYAVPQLTGAALTTPEDVPVGVELKGTEIMISKLPQHGALQKNTDGKLIYTPSPDYTGADGFSLIPRDDLNDGAPTEFSVTIQPVQDAPRPENQTICLVDQKPRKLKLSATNPDAPEQLLKYKIVKQPEFGKLSGTLPDIMYEPAAGAMKNDKIQFTASNGYLESTPGTIFIQPPYSCVKTAGPKTIDGALDDWNDLPIKCNEPEQFRSMGRKAWKGSDDCRFAIGAAYDDKYLYIAVEVIDDIYDAVKDKDPWEQDGIEIRLDARPTDIRSVNDGQGEQKDFLLLAFSSGSTPGETWLYRGTKELPQGTKYICCRTAKGFNAEVAVPMDYLNKQSVNDGGGFRLNVSVNDGDGEKLAQLCWKPDWRTPETYYGSGSFVKK